MIRPFIAAFVIHSTLCYASSPNISVEEFPFGDSKDIRYTISSDLDAGLTEDDKHLLKEFSENVKIISGIKCTPKNLALVKSELQEIDSSFMIHERVYDGSPWILSPLAFQNLPVLDQDSCVTGVQTVVTIEPQKKDCRFVTVKDNKNYGVSPGGLCKEQDGDGDVKFTQCAKRNLQKELNLSIDTEALVEIGGFRKQIKNRFLGFEYHNVVKFFTVHLDCQKTQAWLAKIGMSLEDDSEIVQQKRSGDIERYYVLKPSVLSQKGKIMLPYSDDREISLSAHHAAMNAVVMAGRFGFDDLVTERHVDYLDGYVQYGEAVAKFIKK